MAPEAIPTDTTDLPDVARLVRDVARTGRARLLQVGGEAALLSPTRSPRRRRTPSQADITAALAAAGSWKGLVDADQLKQDLDAARGSDASALEL